jgi:hypothetical protein
MGAALIAGACEGAGNDTDDPISESAGGSPESGLDQVMSGNLGEVDPDEQTFTITVNGREESFEFDEATQVTGASGTQGLSGRQGARVTVHFREDGGDRIARRIEVTEVATPAPR